MPKQLNKAIVSMVWFIYLVRRNFSTFRLKVSSVAFGICISVNSCQNKDAFSYSLFYPPSTLNIKALEKEGFKDEMSDDVSYLRKDINDTTYAYFYNGDSITSRYVYFKVNNIEDSTIISFIKNHPLVLVGDIAKDSKEGKTFVVKNYNTNLFFVCHAIIENGQSLFLIKYDYPKLGIK